MSPDCKGQGAEYCIIALPSESVLFMSLIQFPHIWIDATCIVPDGKGAAVYAISLLKALQTLRPPAYFTILVRQDASERLKNSMGSIDPHWKIQGTPVKSAHLWHLFDLPRLLQKQRPHLLHVLGEIALARLPVPYTIAVHELPHLYRERVGFPSQSPYQWISQTIAEALLPGTCRRAEHVLTLSKSTASDLINEFNLDARRVSVAYPAAADCFSEATAQPLSDWCQSLPRPYLLTFATGDRREVPEQVVQAFGAIASQIPHQLVIAGRCPAWQQSALNRIAHEFDCGSRLHFTGFVNDPDLPLLYRDAAIYIEMSRYEGFGLQVCEAMATGTVAIAADVSSLPEVVGNADYLVPLNNYARLSEKILQLLSNPHQTQALKLLAQQQAALFSWEKCARETWKTIDIVLNNSLA